MQTIERYINELLLVQDKVVVPNLGVFSSQFSPASLNGDVLTPPRKKVDFSIYIREDEKNDDLMKLVMKGENIGYYDFNEKLLAYVQHVQQSIVSHNEYRIEGLGLLFKDTNNKIVFQQDHEVSLLGDSFGLPPIDTTMEGDNIFEPVKPTLEEVISKNPFSVSDTKITTDAPKKQEKETVEQATTTNNQTQEKPVAHVVSDDEEKPNKGKDLAWWLVTVPLVLLLAFISYLFLSPEAMQGFKSLFASKQEVSADMNGKNADDSLSDTSRFEGEQNDIDNKPTDETITEDNSTTPPITDNTAKPNNDTKPIDTKPISTNTNSELEIGKFYLVYGSFSSEQKANTISKKLTSKGLTTKVIPLASKGMYRVVVGDFDSHAAASSKKADLGAEFSQSWVLKAE